MYAWSICSASHLRRSQVQAACVPRRGSPGHFSNPLSQANVFGMSMIKSLRSTWWRLKMEMEIEVLGTRYWHILAWNQIHQWRESWWRLCVLTLQLGCPKGVKTIVPQGVARAHWWMATVPALAKVHPVDEVKGEWIPATVVAWL